MVRPVPDARVPPGAHCHWVLPGGYCRFKARYWVDAFGGPVCSVHYRQWQRLITAGGSTRR